MGQAKKEIKQFRLVLTAPMGTKRGAGRGGFVGSVLNLVDTFYEEVVQGIKPWAAPPPKLRPAEPTEPRQEVPQALVSTSFSSQDGPEPALSEAPGGADVLVNGKVRDQVGSQVVQGD